MQGLWVAISWTTRGHNKSASATRRTAHLGQAQRSPRKRELCRLRKQNEEADACKLGITTDELRQRRFEAIRPQLRDAGFVQAKNTVVDKEVASYTTFIYCDGCDHRISITGKRYLFGSC